MFWRSFLAALSVLSVVTAVSFAQAPAQPRRTALEGVYTAEQARYGEFLYGNNCVQCHGGDLSGRQDANGDAAPLKGDEFYRNHRTKSLGTIFTFMKANMPAGAPGSLKDSDYAAIIAYVLEWNEFPAGQRELPSTVAELNAIWLEAEAAP